MTTPNSTAQASKEPEHTTTAFYEHTLEREGRVYVKLPTLSLILLNNDCMDL